MDLPQWVYWVGGGAGSIALGVVGNLLTPAVRAGGLVAVHHLAAANLAGAAAWAELAQVRPVAVTTRAVLASTVANLTALGMLAVLAATVPLAVIVGGPSAPVWPYAVMALIGASLNSLFFYAIFEVWRLDGLSRNGARILARAADEGPTLPKFDVYLAEARERLGLPTAAEPDQRG